MKVAINTDFGEFSLSKKALKYYKELTGKDCDLYDFLNEEHRADKILIKVIEELGSEANGPLADIKVVEIPDGIDFYIHNYDGLEEIHECHRIWR